MTALAPDNRAVVAWIYEAGEVLATVCRKSDSMLRPGMSFDYDGVGSRTNQRHPCRGRHVCDTKANAIRSAKMGDQGPAPGMPDRRPNRSSATRLESHDSGSGSRYESVGDGEPPPATFTTSVRLNVRSSGGMFFLSRVWSRGERWSRTRMVPMTRDQIPPRLVDGRLVAGGYRCISIDDVSPLRSGEPVEAGGNILRLAQIGPYGTFR